MSERESERVLTEPVEVDDAYLGGMRSGKRGRGAAGKVPMVVGVEAHVDEETGEAHPWFVRFDPLPGCQKKALVEWAEKH